MESPRMYEEGAPDLTFKDFNKSVFSFNNQSDQGLNTLDPTLENVIDLQELINNTLPALEVEGGPLTIDTIFPASDLDLVETHHTPSGNNTDISKVNIFKTFLIVMQQLTPLTNSLLDWLFEIYKSSLN